MPTWDVPARLRTLARTLEDLPALQSKTRTAVEAVETRLRTVRGRPTRVEAQRDMLIIEANAAAGLTATTMSNVFARVTRIEVRQEDAQKRLSPSRALRRRGRTTN